MEGNSKYYFLLLEKLKEKDYPPFEIWNLMRNRWGIEQMLIKGFNDSEWVFKEREQKAKQACIELDFMPYYREYEKFKK